MRKKLLVSMLILTVCMLSVGPAMAVDVVRVNAFNQASGKLMPTDIPMIAIEKSPVLETPSTGGTITGRVTDARTTDPIAGAYVTVYPSDDPANPIYKNMVDADGRYCCTNIPEGVYTVFAHADGYYDQYVTVAVTVGGTVTVDFALTPSPSAEIVFTDRAYDNTLPVGSTTFSNSEVKWLYIYTLWSNISGSHRETIMLYCPGYYLYQIFNISFDTELLTPINGYYCVEVHIPFGNATWSSRLTGTWMAEVYLDAPDYVWDPALEKHVWQGEGDTTCDAVAYFTLTN